MKIKMLQTVEDSHAFAVMKDGKLKTYYDVRKFYKGEEPDHTDAYPDWNRRAQKLIDLGFAEDITPTA